jgi:hypothetical protein
MLFPFRRAIKTPGVFFEQLVPPKRSVDRQRFSGFAIQASCQFRRRTGFARRCRMSGCFADQTEDRSSIRGAQSGFNCPLYVQRTLCDLPKVFA